MVGSLFSLGVELQIGGAAAKRAYLIFFDRCLSLDESPNAFRMSNYQPEHHSEEVSRCGETV
jgi:hypothetical protein